jgi:hypothetical protein
VIVGRWPKEEKEIFLMSKKKKAERLSFPPSSFYVSEVIKLLVAGVLAASAA